MAEYSEDAEIEDSFDGPEPMDEVEYQGYVGSAIKSAVDYIDLELGEDRAEATDLYRGSYEGDVDVGRSRVVSHDVRDTVQQILPSLMRMFFGSKRVINFAPRSAEDRLMAEQCSDYINYIVTEETDSFNTFYSAFKDALVRRTGILKFYWKQHTEVCTSRYTGLDQQQLAILAGQDGVEAVEIEETQAEGQPPEVNARIKYRKEEGKVSIECLPPEEFLINRDARSLEDATIVAHRSMVSVSDLVAMGYDYESVLEVAGNQSTFETNSEYLARFDDSYNRGSDKLDDSNKKVLTIEAYIKIDKDQDGIAELRKVLCLGTAYEVFSDEPCDYIPFVTLTPDPEPHDWGGRGFGVTDIVKDIQRIKTNVMRNVLDSLSFSLNPRTIVQENACNIDDVLNQEIGSIIRVRNMGSVQQLQQPFVGGQALPIIQLLDSTLEKRTGITKASAGTDVESLMSTTRVAIDTAVKASQAHLELLARIFAENGLKKLYKGVFQLVKKYQDKEKLVRLRNQYIPIDPRHFDAMMDVTVDIPLGGASDAERQGFLQSIVQKQEQILQQQGPVNPLVNQQQYYQTLVKTLENAGYADTSQFFSDPAQFKPPPPPEPKPSAEEIYAQIQNQKIVADIAESEARLNLDREKMIREDDRIRDQFEAELQLKIKELETKYSTSVDQATIRGLMEREREEVRQQSLLQRTQMQQQPQPQPTVTGPPENPLN